MLSLENENKVPFCHRDEVEVVNLSQDSHFPNQMKVGNLWWKNLDELSKFVKSIYYECFLNF